MLKLLQKEGVSGIGIYWCVVEMIYEEGGKLMLSDCEGIAFALRTKEEIVKRVVINYQLFRNDGTYFWSESALKRMEERQGKSDKNRKIAKEGWKKRKTDANALPNNSERYAIRGEEIREEGEEKEIREERILNLGDGEIFVTVDTPYAHEKKLRVYSLEKFFEYTGQLEQIKKTNWMKWAEIFIKENPGKGFDDKEHLYNAFKFYCNDDRRSDKKGSQRTQSFGTDYGTGITSAV